MPTRVAMASLMPVLLLTAACERTENEPGPGGVTIGEAKALDDAAEMLESRDGTAAREANAEADRQAR